MKFNCATITGTKNGDSMIVKKNHLRNNILFKSVEKHKHKISKNNICLSPKDSLKLATTIIDEFCRTENKSKKSLKSKIAYQQDIIQNLTKLVEDKKVRIEILEGYLKESKKCVDDLTDLKL